MKKLFLLPLIFISCQKGADQSAETFIADNQVKYARGFAMEETCSAIKIEVYNPWADDAVLARYAFIKDSAYNPVSDEQLIHIPIKKGAFLSSTYLGMMAMLDSRDVVSACVNAGSIYDSALFKKYNDGEILNLGNDIRVNAEKVIGAKPDLVMKYIYQGEDPQDKLIRQVGIPIVYNIEFMETSPLGRAEWIRLVGAVAGKSQLADSLFLSIEEEYLRLKDLAQSAAQRPAIMDGSSFKGTWYTAGGNSFVAQLYKDANTEYFWFTDTTRGSMPLSFEVILQKQGEADYWMNSNASSHSEILAVEARCELLTSFKNKNVYHYNKRVNPNGGFDYFETGVIRPDLVLRDLLVIMHPELFDGQVETFYYKKLD